MADRLQVGNAEIAAATDAEFRYVPTQFIPSATAEQWRAYLGGADPNEAFESRVTTYVIRSQGMNILVDAGVGRHGLWRFGDGHLLDSLKELDLSPEDIDVVVPTHLHLDHVGWNTTPTPYGPVPTFPRARYLFQQLDWDAFTSEEFLNRPSVSPMSDSMQRMIRAAVLPLKDSGQMDLIGPEQVITDEVTLLHTPGHTLGSVSVLVQSGDRAALLIGDVAHNPAQFSESDWSPAVDVDPSLSARTRRGVAEQAIRLEAMVAGGHLASPEQSAFGSVIQMEGRPVWRGVSLKPE
jgi:glyoxylase-like metal-dependent hydrolase (beta-lactamase superfamily II)